MGCAFSVMRTVYTRYLGLSLGLNLILNLGLNLDLLLFCSGIMAGTSISTLTLLRR